MNNTDSVESVESGLNAITIDEEEKEVVNDASTTKMRDYYIQMLHQKIQETTQGYNQVSQYMNHNNELLQQIANFLKPSAKEMYGSNNDYGVIANCDPSRFGRVVGKNGNTIKRLSRDYNVCIIVFPPHMSKEFPHIYVIDNNYNNFNTGHRPYTRVREAVETVKKLLTADHYYEHE